MEKRQIREKICGDCGKKKSIYDFDLSMSGNRREPVCRQCKLDKFKPKQRPKIIGQSKLPAIHGFKPTDGPIRKSEEKQEQKHIPPTQIDNKTQNKQWGKKYWFDQKVEDTDMKTEEIQEQVNKYVENNGDGFTAKELSEFINLKDSSVYYQLGKLNDKRNRKIHRLKVNGVWIYFKNLENMRWLQKRKKEDDYDFNQELIQTIKEKTRETPKKPLDVKIKSEIKGEQLAKDIKSLPERDVIKPGDRVEVDTNKNKIIRKIPDQEVGEITTPEDRFVDAIILLIHNTVNQIIREGMDVDQVKKEIMEEVKVKITTAINNVKDELTNEIRSMEKDIAKEVKKDLLRSLME